MKDLIISYLKKILEIISYRNQIIIHILKENDILISPFDTLIVKIRMKFLTILNIYDEFTLDKIYKNGLR